MKPLPQTLSKATRTLERFKSRLVAKAYTQTYELDYQETFASVVK